MARIGIFGGTFDPPHVGHTIFAEAARAQFELDTVRFVPAGDPYHRRRGSGFEIAGVRDDLSPANDRLEMTRLAVAGNGAFVVDDREVQRDGPSYTVDTLEELTAEFPDAKLFLLLGADTAAELSRWRSADRIGELATVLVASRGDRVAGAAREFPHKVVQMPRVDITATEIRALIQRTASARYLVADAVLEYIERQSLYLRG